MSSPKTLLKLKRSDLARMSHEELVELAKTMQRIDEANAYRTLETYLEHAHAGQITFHKILKRIRLLMAGNRFGKSTAGMVEFIWRNMGTHPFRKTKVPIKSIIVAQDFETHVKTIIEPKLKEWAPKDAIKSIERTQTGAIRRLTWSTGSTTDVLTHEQSLKAFEGSDYDLAWFDEPPPHLIFNAVWRGLTDRGGDCYITGTPIVEPWLFPKFLAALEGEDPLTWAMCGNTYDNAKNLGGGDEELGRKRVDELASQYDIEERTARIDGQFLQMQGLIFKSWSRKHHLIAPFAWPCNWPIWESIDPHPRKPWALSWVGVTPSNHRILIRSGYSEGGIEEAAQAILYARQSIELDVKNKRPRIVRTMIDNYASAPIMTRSVTEPTARRTTIKQELENLIGPNWGGPRVECAPKDVSGKIDIMKSWLRVVNNDSQFYVFDNMENTDRDGSFCTEIENYVWDSKRGGIRAGMKDTPRKEKDDILDTVMQLGLTMPKEIVEQAIIKTVNNLGRYQVSGR